MAFIVLIHFQTTLYAHLWQIKNYTAQKFVLKKNIKMKQFAIAIAVGVISTIVGTYVYVKFIAPKANKPTTTAQQSQTTSKTL